MASSIHRSFAGGECTPALYARADVNRYATWLRLCRNMVVMRHGGTENRPGTVFVAEVKDSSKSVVLVPFVFNRSQTYMLEFGDQYMRVFKNGAPGLEPSKDLVSATRANPGVLTVTAHGFSNGDEVYIRNVEGMLDLNGRNYKVANVTTDTFTLKLMDGTDLDTTSFGAYSTTYRTGKISRVYTIASPFAEADLSSLSFDQSADVIVIAHRNYPVYQLARTGDLSWSFSPYSFEPTTVRPVALSGSAGGAGANTYRYKVTAVAKADAAESLPAVQAAKTISGATQANPVVVTANSHGYDNGDEVYISGVVGMTELNNRVFIVANKAANTFELQDVDGSAYTAYVSGGQSFKTLVTIPTAAAPTIAAPNVISWTPSSLIQEYNVFKEENGQYNFLGVAVGGSFKDVGAATNAEKSPPIFRNPFIGTGNYPGAVAFHSQRLALASTTNEPQKVWESKIGFPHDFSISSPVQDDDAISYKLSGKRLEEIIHLTESGKLVILTSGAETTVGGEAGASLTPFNIQTKLETSNGSSRLAPISVDGLLLYVQAMGSKVRDFQFSLERDRYDGSDLSIYATHLFDGHSLVSWAYQQEPHSIVWAVREDGKLLGLTILRDQEIAGWHRHDTDGLFECVNSIPEGSEYAVYVVVSREVETNGVVRTARYIERMASRLVPDVVDSIFADSALSYDGRNTDPAWTMDLSSVGGGWSETDELTITQTLTTSDRYFSSEDLGKAIRFTGADGTVVDIVIGTVVSNAVVKGLPNKTVPAAMRDATSNWAKLVNTVGGLWHLEGKYISALGDGLVVASPFNPGVSGRFQVVNGQVSFGAQNYHAVYHVGLPYDNDIYTLDLENAAGSTWADKPKLINKVALHVQESRTAFVGTKPPTETSTNHVGELTEMPRQEGALISPIGMVTDTVSVIIATEFNKNGRVFIRNVDPLPMSILAIAESGLIPRA